MKRNIVLALVTLAIGTQAFAQSPRERNGYIGISLGPSFPTGELKNDGLAKTGANISLVNFGYLFANNLGIAAKWSGNANEISDSGEYWSYGTLLAGPLYSLPLSPKVDWDIKGLIGFGAASLDSDYYAATGTGLAYSIGTGIRNNFARKWALTLNLDYIVVKPKGDFEGDKFSAMDLSIGIAYRLK